MKIKQLVLSVFTALSLGVSAFAHGTGHGHDEHKVKAPNGGRVIMAVEPHAEFLLKDDRTIQITFIDDDGKAVAPADQVVTVITGERSSPTKLSFKKSGNVLLSEGTVPAGDGFATVVQIKPARDAKTVTAKFNLDLTNCSGCNLKEYACTCGH